MIDKTVSPDIHLSALDASENQTIGFASDAAGRLFRAYERHCGEPSSDMIGDEADRER